MGTHRCLVELIDVTFIDRSGEDVLAEIMTDGAEFIASDVYTMHLLNNLRRALQRRRAGKRKQELSLRPRRLE
jgi:hypothetical protein